MRRAWRLWRRKRARTRKATSGYPGPGDLLYPTVEEYLVAKVREDYERGEIDDDEMDRRMGRALAGDHVGAGEQFVPIRMQKVWS